MSRSSLQQPFMQEVAENFLAIKKRLVKRLEMSSPSDAEDIIEDELRGLYHGIFVIFDGGTALADKGLIQIVDEDGVALDRFLHEICFDFRPLVDKH